MNKISNPESFRENIRKKFQEIIEEEKAAINLEKGIFNYAIQESTHKKIVKKWENPHFVQIYIDRLRTIFINLKRESLLKLIKENEINTKDLAFMTHQEMAPDIWKEHIERKIKKDSSRYQTNIQASTDMFTCKKCKSKRCVYYELQTRSADEPMTVFITCLDCGKHWKN